MRSAKLYLRKSIILKLQHRNGPKHKDYLKSSDFRWFNHDHRLLQYQNGSDDNSYHNFRLTFFGNTDIRNSVYLQEKMQKVTVITKRNTKRAEIIDKI